VTYLLIGLVTGLVVGYLLGHSDGVLVHYKETRRAVDETKLETEREE
jgi:hypothetical protein